MSSRTNFRHRFQQLRWKLTLSYTSVTVGALLTVELIFLLMTAIVVTVLLNSGVLQAELIKAVGNDYSPSLRLLLSQTPPDQDAIAGWLDRVGMASGSTIPLTFDASEELFIVGSDGVLLGSRSPGLFGHDAIGHPLDVQALSGLAGPLRAALAGDEEVEHLYNRPEPDERVIMAIPVWDKDHEKVLGALIGLGDLPTVASTLSSILPIMGISFLVFTLIAGIAGTVYGSVAARGLTARLDQLSEATLAWSQGDFTKLVDDPSGDEIGQLAYRLNQMAGQLQQLLDTRRELVVVDERNRLARELHDSAKQQAFAAAAQISAGQNLLARDPEKAAEHIVEAERLIYDLRQELTSLIQKLRPAALQGKGLYEAVHQYGTDWARQNGITLEVRAQGKRGLPLEFEQTIFRIIQGALSNTARHSQAAHVDVELVYAPDTFSCAVRDDGVGFDPGTVPDGFGLRSMQERATSLGGRLSIESTINRGTLITLSVPYTIQE